MDEFIDNAVCKTIFLVEANLLVCFLCPVGTIEESLNLSPRQFKAIFGVDQPQPEDTNIVFHCLGGVRSANALHAALELGYDKYVSEVVKQSWTH